jgi:hypothetical protein
VGRAAPVHSRGPCRRRPDGGAPASPVLASRREP